MGAHNESDRGDAQLYAVEVSNVLTVCSFPAPACIALLTSCRLFSHIILVWCFRHCGDPRVPQVVPSRYRSWCNFALGFLQETAYSGPTLAKDAEIATILCQDLIA